MPPSPLSCRTFLSRDGLLQFEKRGVPPQPFQAVVLTLVRSENVDDNVSEVEENPTTIIPTLCTAGALTLERLFYCFDDCPAVDAVAGGGNNEEVGHRGVFLHVQDNDSLGQLLLGGTRRQKRLPPGLHYAPPSRGTAETAVYNLCRTIYCSTASGTR